MQQIQDVEKFLESKTFACNVLKAKITEQSCSFYRVRQSRTKIDSSQIGKKEYYGPSCNKSVCKRYKKPTVKEIDTYHSKVFGIRNRRILTEARYNGKNWRTKGKSKRIHGEFAA